jgi:hypothetical protein
MHIVFMYYKPSTYGRKAFLLADVADWLVRGIPAPQGFVFLILAVLTPVCSLKLSTGSHSMQSRPSGAAIRLSRARITWDAQQLLQPVLLDGFYERDMAADSVANAKTWRIKAKFFSRLKKGIGCWVFKLRQLYNESGWDGKLQFRPLAQSDGRIPLNAKRFMWQKLTTYSKSPSRFRGNIRMKYFNAMSRCHIL